MERELSNRLKSLQQKLKDSLCLLIHYIDSKEISNLISLCNSKISHSGEKIYDCISKLALNWKTCGINTKEIYQEIIGTINSMIEIENQKQLISSKSPKIMELFPGELSEFLTLKSYYYGRRGVFGFYGSKTFDKIRHIDFLKKSIKKDQKYFEKLDKLAEKRCRIKVTYTYSSGPLENPIFT